MPCDFGDLPGDIWMSVLRDWVACPHDFARLDTAASNRKLRSSVHSALKGFVIPVHISVPRNATKMRKMLLWLISRSVKVEGLENVEVSYAKDLVEFLDDYPELGRALTTIGLRKTVTGARNTMGMDQMPQLLSLLPRLQHFWSVLGSYYSPVYEEGPHYVACLPSHQLESLTEEIGRPTDLDRIRDMAWPSLKRLTLTQAFIHDECLLELVASPSFSHLQALHIHKFDEFHSLDVLPLDTLQWHDFPVLSNLKELTLSHWNEQSPSNNATVRVLSNFLVHRSPHLRAVALEGRYVTDFAVQQLLLRHQEVQTLALRNTCDTLDATCALLASQRPVASLRELCLDNVPAAVAQALLPVACAAHSVFVKLREPARGQAANALSLGPLFAAASRPSWRTVHLTNISLSVGDAQRLFQLVPSLSAFEWEGFAAFSAVEWAEILRPTEVASALATATLRARTSTTRVDEAACAVDATTGPVAWLQQHCGASLRRVSLAGVPLHDAHVALLCDPAAFPRLVALALTGATALPSGSCPSSERSTLRAVSLHSVAACAATDVARFLRRVPRCLALQLERCGHLVSSDAALREAVAAGPVRIVVDGQRVDAA